ncbi:MAG: hypothetical protein LUH07_03205 [Lachnospiraceae bacterium]|nr:hypothetical protein [Lachnospiraceae bacterium]
MEKEKIAANPEDEKRIIQQEQEKEKEKEETPQGAVSETWAEDNIAELDDFIESQGIYIRQ